MTQCNGKTTPSKALVKGLAKELEISEYQLEKLADEVRKDLAVTQTFGVLMCSLSGEVGRAETKQD
jgi:hypothetical protein